MNAAIKIVSEGRRHYITGNTYPIKDQLRSAGAKWDAERKAWWTGKREVAEQFVSASVGVVHQDAPERPAAAPSNGAPGESATVAGKATYKGRTYYIAGRVARGRTSWDDRVDAVTSRDGSRVLLYFRDGSSQFWASRADVQIGKVYDRPQTIARLQAFAAEARAAGGADAAIADRAEKSGRCRGCGGALVSAAHHAAMDGYCGSCAFDEYDC